MLGRDTWWTSQKPRPVTKQRVESEGRGTEPVRCDAPWRDRRRMGCPGPTGQKYEAKGQCDREAMEKRARTEAPKPGWIYASLVRRASSACAFHHVIPHRVPLFSPSPCPQASPSAVRSHAAPPACLPHTRKTTRDPGEGGPEGPSVARTRRKEETGEHSKGK